MAPIKNVVLIGAGGNLGPSVLKALQDSPAKFNITVLSRKSSSSKFPSGVKVVTVSDDYPESEVVDAFKGQDAVVSTINGMGATAQIGLIDAAVKAGVKRFIPADFGLDVNHGNPALKAVPMFDAKKEVAERLKKAEKEGLTWSSIINGIFLDWCLKVGFLGFNLKDKTAQFGNDGRAQFSATGLPRIGLAVARVLERPEETANKVLFIQSVATSQQQILELAEKFTGEKWKVTNVDLKTFQEERAPKSKAGDIGASYEIIWADMVGGYDSIYPLKKEGFANPILGLEDESIESYVERWVKGQA